jgi:N4-(beta-N-acetylglucosaminyl)-L-asparaginase
MGTTLSASALAAGCSTAEARSETQKPAPDARTSGLPVLIGSANALPGMKAHYARLVEGADPLDVAIDVVKITEADPNDDSVGLGGLPNEDGVVQLDAACMYGPRHKSGAVACIENILHPSEVARLVLERTDHCLIVGRGAYEFARAHGHPHTELLTEASRKKWMEWKESMSTSDDRLPAPPKLPYPPATAGAPAEKTGARLSPRAPRVTGTIHCSALAKSGAIACTTTTSGLAWKIPGRAGDSPIIGAGLYCDQEAGSAGATGRGEACILANGSFAIVEMLRRGAHPVEAGLEVLKRVVRQTQRQARYQPDLVDADGQPSFGLHFYVLGLDGSFAGVTLRGAASYAVADPDHGPRLETLVALLA